MPRIILASASPHRRAQMRRLGAPFEWRAPVVDEEALKTEPRAPAELAMFLAERKALSVAELEPDAIVIGGDQLVAFEGAILGKPGSVEAAVAQLLAMAGKTHELVTALVVARGGRVERHLEIARMTLRPITRAEAERYVEIDQPLDCAGAYKFEQRGIFLFDRVEAPDPNAITGLPLMALGRILRGMGIAIP